MAEGGKALVQLQVADDNNHTLDIKFVAVGASCCAGYPATRCSDGQDIGCTKRPLAAVARVPEAAVTCYTRSCISPCPCPLPCPCPFYLQEAITASQAPVCSSIVINGGAASTSGSASLTINSPTATNVSQAATQA